MTQSRILIVDDEEEICEMLSDFLVERGFEAFRASTGTEALNLVKEVRPHLLLLDIRMPEMDGIEILTQIRSIDQEVCIIMITGYHDVDIARQALKLGASDFITKPVDLEYLGTSIDLKVKAMLAV
jgi:DNA-binding NtrC family response regulator